MKFWTIQTIQCYEYLLDKGSICGDKSFIDSDFLHSYHWLMQKMDARIGKRPSPDCFPVWAWSQYEGAKKKKPDLRSIALLPKGTKGVRIEINKNENEVLLSDFDLWHYALNKWFLGKNETEGIAFDTELNCLEKKGFNVFEFEKLPTNTQHKIIESWDKILDLEFNDPYYTYPKDKKSIQATFWTLSIHEIIKVETFVAR